MATSNPGGGCLAYLRVRRCRFKATSLPLLSRCARDRCTVGGNRRGVRGAESTAARAPRDVRSDPRRGRASPGGRRGPRGALPTASPARGLAQQGGRSQEASVLLSPNRRAALSSRESSDAAVRARSGLTMVPIVPPGRGARTAFRGVLADPHIDARAALRFDVRDYFNSIDVPDLLQRLPESFTAGPIGALLRTSLLDRADSAIGPRC